MSTIGQVEFNYDPDFSTWNLRSYDKLPVFATCDLYKLDSHQYSYGQDGKNGCFALVVPSSDMAFDYKFIVEMLENRRVMKKIKTHEK